MTENTDFDDKISKAPIYPDMRVRKSLFDRNLTAIVATVIVSFLIVLILM